ncbi:hypothetical protein SEA_RIOVINA_33 [Arthrobacter phage Riovina]|uniref:Uncharacterized protein n=4 Tax=Korravirus hunterdalle TaxID=1982080 RepID=A0A3G8FV70_9CAUD|nr:hypothetical protein SEA_ALEDEL_33 [Arthrobacter phage Aledel]AZS07718.1 hypothetical protein SEA_EUNOIA_33 [Arthrobacter phage Eunoia]AZS09180.1 hypothetical protein SEA_OMALLEY_33 [Arthrobacter phage OMalley]AZS09664.1 hypothetical protein SEA_RIOVINA_33 [Arthrobacter phage Riovina]AZS10410.1 hypothetical protein SEA_SUPAKEV_33 [Arthrobacter phage Supakev]
MPSIKNPGPPSDDEKLVRRSSKARLDFIRGAVRNARKITSKGAYRGDKALQRATLELRDAGELLLALADDPNINGPMDLGREFVNRRAAQFRAYYERNTK